MESGARGESEKKICESASMPMAVTVLVEAPDRSLVPVNDATVSFKCINEVCDLGSTEKKDGRIFTAVPACINGLLIAKKEGMYQGKEFVDSNEPGSATVIMDFLYDLDLDVKILQSGIERS
ncbi:MAG: hypothetical protein KKC53_06025, partial [Actinobacteria bacterium]|nr:hypothetical protein [Actinomycetota bacterium]